MTQTQRFWRDQIDGHGPVFGEKPRPEDVIGQPLAFALSGHPRHAILIAEASGHIRFATTRNLFGWSDEELPGCSLQSLIPSLPVRPNTPGYNIAYVRMTFEDRVWKSHRALRADGQELPVELSIHTVPIGRSYALLVAVREMPSNHAYIGALSKVTKNRNVDQAMTA